MDQKTKRKTQTFSENTGENLQDLGLGLTPKA